jgi:hypothetical protein
VLILGKHTRRLLTELMNIRTGNYPNFALAEFNQKHFQKSWARFDGIGGAGELSCSCIEIRRTKRERVAVSRVNSTFKYVGYRKHVPS